MKLISIIAGAALLTGCAGPVGIAGYDCIANVGGYPTRLDSAETEDGIKLRCENVTLYDGTSARVYMPEDEKYRAKAMESANTYAKYTEPARKARKKREEANSSAAIQLALNESEKCISAFAKLIGIAAEGKELSRSDVTFTAYERSYIETSTNYFYKKYYSADIGSSYVLTESVAFRQSPERIEYRKKINAECAKAIYTIQCLQNKLLLEMKEAEKEVANQCK
nr:MAG TPA: TRAF PROTEIN, TRAO PROTEIN, TRAN ADHESION, BACTERIAL SECRETION.5A [Caudoviricetes sp.]